MRFKRDPYQETRIANYFWVTVYEVAYIEGLRTNFNFSHPPKLIRRYEVRFFRNSRKVLFSYEKFLPTDRAEITRSFCMKFFSIDSQRDFKLITSINVTLYLLTFKRRVYHRDFVNSYRLSTMNTLLFARKIPEKK